ncbi:hypothetical protein ACQ4PT_031097 [Festuca glaucescens]
MVWLLDDYYDVEHWAFLMAEKRKVLRPLKIRSHGASSSDMPYDERYTPHIASLGLLPFITLVSQSTPNLNAAAITTLVDRWRPETHTFHLRTSEMTPTLQDVSMILGLPINGDPLCMSTDSDGWRQQMEALIGMAPKEPEDKAKDKVPVGVTYKWIVENFAHYPIEANEDTVKKYTRVYVWYVISRTLFADGGGRTAQWMWLKALTILEHKWSWGSAALAYLYRQLDDACRRIGNDSGIGGALLLLSVDWQPYGGRDHFATSFDALNPKCLEEEYLWPMRLDKKNKRKIKNWPDHHRRHVTKFEHCLEAAKLGAGSQLCEYCTIAFNNYVRWFISSTRVKICPPAYEDEILEEPICFNDVAENTYNRLVRQGSHTPFAPVLNFVRSEIKKHADECENAYDTYPRGEKGESALRVLIKRSRHQLRRLGNLLGCRDPEIATPSQSRSGSPPHPSPHVGDTTSANVEDNEV